MIKLSRKVLCLDWDKRSLRIVVAKVGKGRTVLEDAHSHRLPSTVDADEPEALGDFIRSMLRRHRLNYKSVVVDVPRERAVINRLTLPPTPTNEVASAVRFQAMKELPFPLDTAAMDYVIMSRDENGLATEVLLAAVTLETLDRVRQTCQAAGLTPSRIGLRPYANLISARQTRAVPEGRVLFVDVGPGATEIDVMSVDHLVFARSANVNVPLVTSENVTTDSRIYSLAEVSDMAASDEAIENAVNELLVETMRTIQAYRATEPEGRIDEVIVAGGTGIETPLSERLHKRLDLPVQLFDPTETLHVASTEAPKLRSFAAALGLAWGLGREGLLALDFLNPKRSISARETLQRRARYAVFAASIVLIIIAAIVIRMYRNISGQLDDQRRANDKVFTEVLELRKLQLNKTDADAWRNEVVVLDELYQIDQIAAEIAAEAPRLNEGQKPGEKLVVQEVIVEAGGKNPMITLRNVHVTDFEVANRLVSRLNDLTDPNDGKPLYEASQGDWNPLKDMGRYTGKVDVKIKLRHYQLVQAKQAAERANQLKNLNKPPEVGLAGVAK